MPVVKKAFLEVASMLTEEERQALRNQAAGWLVLQNDESGRLVVVESDSVTWVPLEQIPESFVKFCANPDEKLELMNTATEKEKTALVPGIDPAVQQLRIERAKRYHFPDEFIKALQKPDSAWSILVDLLLSLTQETKVGMVESSNCKKPNNPLARTFLLDSDEMMYRTVLETLDRPEDWEIADKDPLKGIRLLAKHRLGNWEKLLLSTEFSVEERLDAIPRLSLDALHTHLEGFIFSEEESDLRIGREITGQMVSIFAQKLQSAEKNRKAEEEEAAARKVSAEGGAPAQVEGGHAAEETATAAVTEESQNATCPNCGAAVMHGETTCRGCGAALEEKSTVYLGQARLRKVQELMGRTKDGTTEIL